MQTNRPTNESAEALIGKYFPVLDHGFVCLVDYMGTDQCVERAARVSYGQHLREPGQTRSLIRYLRRHRHTTPSEMVELKFHCSMPIFVARQWIRHRTANVNEISGRYTKLPTTFYMPERAQVCSQSKKNKQGRGEPLPDSVAERARHSWAMQREVVSKQYDWMCANDFANEIARIDLPLSTYTEWYWKIDLHNLLHFLTLRVDKHAQWEIQQFGEVMAGMVERIAPLSYEAWLDYDVAGARFSHQELQILRAMLGTTDEYVFGKGSSFKYIDLAGRELDEFRAKLESRERPSFTLDLSKAIELEGPR
jgi:thymidylate synthase (FAD)